MPQKTTFFYSIGEKSGLKEREIFDYSATDFEQDRETLREFRMREARP
jgi:hypothetical protein